MWKQAAAGIILLAFVFFLPAASAVDFMYSPSYPSTSESIQFTIQVNESVHPVMYSWDYGDGNHSSGKGIVYHRYSDDGNYTVTLTIVDSDTNVHQCNHTIMVNNTPPAASFTWDRKYPNPEDPIHFEAGGSSDSDGEIVSYIWNISGIRKQGENVVHAFIQPGGYNITLTVTDDDNDTGVCSKHVIVAENKPPDAVFTVRNTVIKENTNISFTDASTDPDGHIRSYSWSFGDGETSTDRHPVHQYKKQGQYTVTLQVTDDDGATASYATDITVTKAGNKDIPGFSCLLLLLSFSSLLVSHRYLYGFLV